MKKFLKFPISLLIAIALAFGACQDLLDTEPRQQLAAEEALEDFNGVSAVITGVYNELQGARLYGRNEVVIADVLSDNLRLTRNSRDILLAAQNNEPRANIDSWEVYFPMIISLNNALAAVDNIIDGTEAQKDQIKGEAHFLRALAYHNLVRTYGREPGQFVSVEGQPFDLGVPIITTPVSKLGDIGLPERATVAANYAQIEQDLSEAIELLGNGGGDFPFVANQIAAQALLARVLLYQQKWAQAAQAATEAIAASPVGLSANYQEIFSEDAESLFALEFGEIDANGLSQFLVLQNNAGGDGILRQDFLNNIEPGDLRFVSGPGAESMLLQTVNGTERVTYSLKYNNWQGADGADNVPVIRLSEMYLVRAEANLENGSSIGASPQDDLDAIRSRAGLPTVVATLDNLLKERRMELLLEGHRFYDLKRRGLPIPKGVDGVDCTSCMIPYEDFRLVNEILEAELDANPNLVDNPGY